MSFFLETTDMDFGNTPIENIFINDFMPMANGTYVKVYLLGYKYAYDRDAKVEVNNQVIAKHLEIPLEDVLRAWDFWESKGIIEKIYEDENDKYNYKVKFLNLKQLYIKNNLSLFTKEEEIKVPRTATPKELIEANQIPIINRMFNNIDDILKRPTTPTEKQKILSWIQNYNMNPDVIETAFAYGVERKRVRKNINYIEGIIRNWYDEGLTNMEALLEYFKTQDEKYYRYQRVMKALGFNRLANEGEMKVIDKWFDEYGFSMEMVLKGCEGSSKTANPSVNYIDGILASWHKKDIKTIEEIEEKDKPEEKLIEKIEVKSKPSKSKTTPKKTGFHNFKQRTENYTAEELEEIARRKREAHFKRVKGEA